MAIEDRRAAASAYIPALRFRALTRFYEPVVRLTLKDEQVKAKLARDLALRSGMRVVDVGCGPGALAVRLARENPDVDVLAVDGDAEVLDIARRKAEAAGVRVDFRQGLATAPPVKLGSCERVVMSLVLHHLLPPAKAQALAAAFSLLRPGGEIHVVEWGKSSGPLMRALFLSIQVLDGFSNTRDHVAGRLPELLGRAGFTGVEETHRTPTIYGTLSVYRGAKPSATA